MGIIDSLSKGFQNVHRHWWLILIPVVLDLFLWVGPQASIEQLMSQTMVVMESSLSNLPAEAGAENLLEAFGELVNEFAPRYSAFSSLRVGQLGVPSLLTWGEAWIGSPSIYESLWFSFLLITDMPDLLVSVSNATFIDKLVWEFSTPVQWFLAILLLTLLGTLIGCIYMNLVAKSLKQDQEPQPFWPPILRLGSRMLLFWVVRVAVLLVLGIPMLLILSVISMLSMQLAALVSTVVLGLITWLSFYGIFFVAALTTNNVSIWRAIWNSFNVVLRNFWSTLWLFVLINLIGGGLTILWQQLSTGEWWTCVGIVGNAYIGTSLVGASLVFYQDRYTRWQQILEKVLSQQGKRMA